MATLYGGYLSYRTPILFVLGFILLFTIGGVSGIILSNAGLDIAFHDTMYVTGHFHYVSSGDIWVKCKMNLIFFSVWEICPIINSTPTCLNSMASVSIKLRNNQTNILFSVFVCYSRTTPIESRGAYHINVSRMEQKPALKGIM